MLLPIEIDLILKKGYYKRNSVKLSSSNGSKMIFVRLTEIITFQVKLSAVDVRGLGFEFVPR